MFMKEKNPDRKRKKKRKKGVLILHLKKQDFLTSILETSSWLVFHDWFPMKFVFTNNISLVWWEINKIISKPQEKKMSCEHALNFDQWKIFSENYKPMRVRLWLVYKFTENQTQKRYPTSFDKVGILTWKLLVISS